MSVAKAERELELLLDYLKGNRGFDFTGYKRGSLGRRIQKRMQAVNVNGFSDYVDYLEVHPEEYSALFNTILINVTSFFRDPAAWETLQREVLPDLLSRKNATESVRVWSAGCASGEEAYTLAIVLAESVGADEFRERVKIYATDVDEEALLRGRAGVYSAHEIEGVPEEFRSKYFDRVENQFAFKKDLRRQVIFGRHDLIQDAPISRVDLLVCRNTLMYFNAETQSRILARFHFALNDYGILFLGRAETLLTHASTFTPVDLKRRISTKIPRANLNLRDRLILMAQNGGGDGTGANTQHGRLREAAADALPIAQIVVDATGVLVQANERARALFVLMPDDVGRPLQDLKISYRPVELRSLLEQVYSDRRPLMVRDISWAAPGNDHRWLDLHLVPIIEEGGAVLGASAAFTDVSATKRLQHDLEHANQELEAAYEELQSTNEELETTNEELQSTVEELETTNEELQSTNEELETMNEELQSTNEELTTMNDELRVRSDELHTLNALLESMLRSFRGAVVVVDMSLQVLVWNVSSEDLWGLRSDEVVGKNFLSFDIGLPVEKLKKPIKACLSQQSFIETEVDATNRRGRSIRCRVGFAPLLSVDKTLSGAIVTIGEIPTTSGSDGPVASIAKKPAER
jgi:two-component system, chemotaxis family, CheB/CheR fusion protein